MVRAKNVVFVITSNSDDVFRFYLRKDTFIILAAFSAFCHQIWSFVCIFREFSMMHWLRSLQEHLLVVYYAENYNGSIFTDFPQLLSFTIFSNCSVLYYWLQYTDNSCNLKFNLWHLYPSLTGLRWHPHRFLELAHSWGSF